MKKFKNIMLALIAMMTIFALSCSSNDPNGGSGGGIYIITEAAHLTWLASQTTNITANIHFDADIDMDSENFGGIKKFSGSMDGNNKIIKNLFIEKTTGNAGLIIEMSGGKIKNLTIESGSIKATDANAIAGAFVGKNTGNVSLEGVINKATVTATTYAGGIIGFAYSDTTTTIKNASNTGAINATYAGGIIGYTGGGTTTINFVFNYKDINMVGNGDATITKSYCLNTVETGVTTLTVDEFTDKTKFVDWKFDTIWKMGTEYPLLIAFN